MTVNVETDRQFSSTHRTCKTSLKDHCITQSSCIMTGSDCNIAPPLGPELDILLVSGDPTVHELIESLKDCGIQVIVALDGLRCLTALKSFAPALILLDFELSGMDALELCRTLKGRSNTRNIPVVFMLPPESIGTRPTIFAAGAADYLLKPLLLEDLAAKFNAHLRPQSSDTDRAVKQQTLLKNMLSAQRIASIGSWELDLVNNVLSWSDEIFNLFEIDPAQFGASYQAFLDAVHPDDRDAVNSAYTESLIKREAYQIEHRLLLADGRIKHVLERCETQYATDGTPLFSQGTAQDITERKRMEDTLKFITQNEWQAGDELFLPALARHLGQMLNVDYMMIGKPSATTNHVETVALYAKGDLLPSVQYDLRGTPCDKVMGGELCCYRDHVQGQFPEDSLLADMRVKSYAGLPLRNSLGNVIGLIAVMDGKPIHNETAIVSLLQLVATCASAELQRRQSEQVLADSQRFLASVLDNIADPVFVKDRQHRWVKLNQAFCDFLGQPLETLLGKSDYDFFPAHEADVFWEKDELVFNHGEENVNEEAFTDSNGITRTIITKKVCYSDEHGQQFLVGCITDITQRKQLELSLLNRAQLQAQLSGLAASVPGFIYTIRRSVDGHISFPFASAGIRDLFGLEPEDIRADASALRARYHPDDLPRLLAHNDESAANLSPLRLEIRAHHPLNGWRWLEIRSMPHRQADGSTEWHGLMIDITERKTNEERLVMLDYALDHVHEALYLMDENANFIQVNEEACRALGYTRDELLTMSVFDIDPDFGPADWKNLTSGMRNGILSITLETRHRGKDGRIFPVEINTNSVTYQNQNLSMALVRDITERRQAQDLLSRREREFRTLAENLPSIVVRYDRQYRRVYFNQLFSQAMGISADAALGKTPREFWRFTTPNAQEFSRLLQDVMDTGTPRHELLSGHIDGAYRYYSMHFAPEYDNEGQVIGVLTCSRDITELKTAEHKLEDSHRQLRALAARSEQARENERKRIAREMHDELGQRLTALRFDLSRLRMRFGDENPELLAQIMEMKTAMDSTIQIVRDVASRLRPAVLNMGIASALEWLMDDFHHRTGIECKLLSHPKKLAMDDVLATALFRIVQESLTNIARHAAASTVNVVLDHDADHYLLEISDNGIGFDSRQPRKAGSFGLMGIEERVIMLAGTLNLDTAPGRGLKLTIHIPEGTKIGEQH